MCGHFGCSFALALDGFFQRTHGCVDGLGIALGVGGFQGLGGLHHDLVAFAQGGLGMLALLVLALEGFVQRLAEGIPQLLFVLALQRHALSFLLPALLQRLDGVDAQAGGSAEFARLVDHGLTHLYAGLLRRLKMSAGFGHGGLPARLQLGKHLFAQVAGLSPAAGEAEQVTMGGLPVGHALLHLPGMLLAPSLEFVHQMQTCGLLFGGMLLHGCQPGLDDAVGLVAGGIKALPERVVGHAALVGLLPLLAQVAQGFLQLARAELAGRHRTRAGGLGLGCGFGFQCPGGRCGLRLGGFCLFCLAIGFSGRQGCIRCFGSGSSLRVGGLGTLGALGTLGRRCRCLRGRLGRLLSRRRFRDFCLRRCGHFCRRCQLHRRGTRFRFAGYFLLWSFRSLVCRRLLLRHRAFRAVNQRLGLLYQFLADLIGAPALPAFQFASRSQHGMGLSFQLGANLLAMLLQGIAQRLRRSDTGLAVAAHQFLLQCGDSGLHRSFGIGTALHLGRVPGCCRLASCFRSLGRRYLLATQHAQFVGPHGHRGQRTGSVLDSGTGLTQRILEGAHHQLQLFNCAFQLRHMLGIDALPGGILLQRLRLLAPVRHIGIQAGFGGIGLLPALGRQHLDALSQQHGGFSVHLHTGLQVLDGLDALGQLQFEAGQRLLAQRCTGLGGVALPGHGVGNIELGRLQQLLGLGTPLGCQQFLALAALDFIQLLAQRLGRALIARAQFLEDFLHAGQLGFGGEPGAHAGGAIARRGGGEHAPGQGVERMRGLAAGSGGGSAGFRAPCGGGIIGFGVWAGSK